MTSQEFEALYVRYRYEWVTFARKLTRHHQLAKDVVQNVILGFLEKGLDKLDADGNPESMVRNAIKMYVMRYVWTNKDNRDYIEQNTVTLESIERSKEGARKYMPKFDDDDTTTPLEPAIREALSTLSDSQQDIVILRVYAKLEFREIGAMLGLTPKSVARRYDRAVRRLQSALENVGISGPPFFGNRLPERDQTAA